MASGTWSLRSASDPRWNTSGTLNVGLGGLEDRPHEAEIWVEDKTRELGQPPKDLTIEVWRD